MTRRRYPATLTAAAIALLTTPTTIHAATTTKQLTIYATATQAQYIDHSDDRERGLATNPFNADTKKLPPTKTKGKGTQPGDEARYSFNLYTDPTHTKQIGTAVYTCRFNFNKNALCQADYQLNNNTIHASGPTNFNTTTLTLAVNSGTGTYISARGQVTSTPTTKNTHRLTFTLL